MKILLTLNDQGGGACINWNQNELTSTLRSEDHGHPPIVVLEDDDGED